MAAGRATKKQQGLLEFIDRFIKDHGFGPSYREIMTALGYKSVSTVAVHIDGLIAHGYLRKRDRSARSIEVVTLRTPERQVDPLPHTGSAREGKRWLRSMIDERIQREGEVFSDETKTLLAAARILEVEGMGQYDEANHRQLSPGAQEDK